MNKPSKLKYNVALSGEFELQEIKHADVFRVLRTLHPDWKELIHNEEWIDATLDNELIAIVRNDPALYEKVLIYAAYAEIIDRLATDGRLVASIGAVFESLDTSVLSDASQAKLQEATEEGLVCEMLEFFNDAVDRAISAGEFNIRVDPVSVPSEVVSAELVYLIRDGLVEQVSFATNGNLDSTVTFTSDTPLLVTEVFPGGSRKGCSIQFYKDMLLVHVSHSPDKKNDLLHSLLSCALNGYRVLDRSSNKKLAEEIQVVLDKMRLLDDPKELSDTFSDWLF